MQNKAHCRDAYIFSEPHGFFLLCIATIMYIHTIIVTIESHMNTLGTLLLIKPHPTPCGVHTFGPLKSRHLAFDCGPIHLKSKHFTFHSQSLSR